MGGMLYVRSDLMDRSIEKDAFKRFLPIRSTLMRSSGNLTRSCGMVRIWLTYFEHAFERVLPLEFLF
ncbi:hypothetical protein C5Y96_25490 [Blastopirellula marina]|uniref:Uncharacterized protein n=1 Tax=Blastopirellula marina TaxID=124 RepID=A0A2S8EZB3_9BACT|nr:hypothetical protein C5Y96_25490 [Blastopirellula marina]RCS41693.1 hypothetical protein DTL36_25540 [Bremerella cremea]